MLQWARGLALGAETFLLVERMLGRQFP